VDVKHEIAAPYYFMKLTFATTRDRPGENGRTGGRLKPFEGRISGHFG
jgi:hypothetical protein